MTEQLPNCPEYGSAYTYEDRGLLVCPECGHEQSPTEEVAGKGLVIKDSNGNLSMDGDSVAVIKDLKVRGASGAIKQSIKMKNIHLVEGDHNIDCKVNGFSPVELKSELAKEN